MLLFEHKQTSERVLTPADSPEGVRLAADTGWAVIEPVEPVDAGPTPAPDAKGTTSRRSTPGTTSDKTEG